MTLDTVPSSRLGVDSQARKSALAASLRSGRRRVTRLRRWVPAASIRGCLPGSR